MPSNSCIPKTTAFSAENSNISASTIPATTLDTGDQCFQYRNTIQETPNNSFYTVGASNNCMSSAASGSSENQPYQYINLTSSTPSSSIDAQFQTENSQTLPTDSPSLAFLEVLNLCYYFYLFYC